MSRSKFALVIPFSEKDKNDVIFNLSLWKIDGHKISRTYNKFIKYDIDLVFYYCSSDDSNTEEIKNRVLEFSKDYKSSFKSIIFDSLILKKEDDIYPKAPGLMFFNFLFGNLNYEAFFYCEADCLPVKNNWIRFLNYEFKRSYKNDTWVKGTDYSGKVVKFKNQAEAKHINGNAIFRIKTKKATQVFNQMSEKILQLETAYDVAMMKYFYFNKNKSLKELYFSHCEYTDFILNYGKCEIPTEILSKPPHKSCFIHGNFYLSHLKSKYST